MQNSKLKEIRKKKVTMMKIIGINGKKISIEKCRQSNKVYNLRHNSKLRLPYQKTIQYHKFYSDFKFKYFWGFHGGVEWVKGCGQR